MLTDDEKKHMKSSSLAQTLDLEELSYSRIYLQAFETPLFEEPGEARDCSTNTVVTDELTA